ncbi:SDR family oxidoreductase [Bradyrhizobium vignae]|uniref:SDR family oxidoreductase n=1 Tax=Bradyrhizobium vignae TaxID=1549949 RepID=UPI001FDF0D58|nr:SDR family oxidoreductase [Bradyrhizobium vignae]
MVAHVLALAGCLDILVLNAGCQFVAAIDQFPDHEWERLRSVMLDGPFFAMKAAWSALTKSPGGRIVVTASTASFAGAPQKTAYTAAKHGVLGLVRVAALEGAGHGLTVNAVAPGWMDTGMMRDQLKIQAATMGVCTDEAVERLRAAQPAKRFVDVREVAATIGFLVNPGASGVNGVCIAVTS